MIDYELALRLKNAGFPQESTGDVFPSTYYERGGRAMKYRHIHNENGVKIPTLSELIVACGEEFVELTVITWGRMWHATSKAGRFVGKGSTPETAVANLWLALNGV